MKNHQQAQKKHDGGSSDRPRFKQLAIAAARLADAKKAEEVAVYDETNADLAYLISGFTRPDFPVPLGVLKETRKPAYEELYYDQIKAVGDTKGEELEALLAGPDAWEIK